MQPVKTTSIICCVNQAHTHKKRETPNTPNHLIAGDGGVGMGPVWPHGFRHFSSSVCSQTWRKDIPDAKPPNLILQPTFVQTAELIPCIHSSGILGIVPHLPGFGGTPAAGDGATMQNMEQLCQPKSVENGLTHKAIATTHQKIPLNKTNAQKTISEEPPPIKKKVPA